MVFLPIMIKINIIFNISPGVKVLGDRYIYDVIKKYVPDHLLKTGNGRIRQEILSSALEKYMQGMGIKSSTGVGSTSFIEKLQAWQKDGFYGQYQRVRIGKQ